ncbi:phosphotransferase enzyme family protein [Paenibacillus sp. OV219]|uniref:phosphotransferase enzyme family protein n=1 Tax=Paenibacillus sp. OV219 TaxID=1884377 RepID=UPI00210D9583|nr:phosphotransferase [Paenibacillus sp. OV219]
MELSLEHFSSIAPHVGTPRTLIQMSSGFSNDNYILTTSQSKYRVRVSKYSKHTDELLAEQLILSRAAEQHNLIVPMLRLFRLPNGTNVSIFPYLEADLNFDINNEELMRDAGKALAHYHLSVDGYTGSLPWKPLSEAFGHEVLQAGELSKFIDDQALLEYPNLWCSIESLLQRMEDANVLMNEEPCSLLPQLPCHGDFAPANLLTHGNRITGMIDFECCRWAPRLYDLSTFLISLQEDEGFEMDMSTWFLEGYNSVLPLSENELKLIPKFQYIRSLEAAKRHFIRVLNGDHRMHFGLIMYWERVTIDLRK